MHGNPPNPFPVDPEGPWFLPFFAFVWLAMNVVLAFSSGWISLAKSFRAQTSLPPERFRFASASIGRHWFPVGYGNCLTISVSSHGIGFAAALPFRFLSPPLLIPWSQISQVSRGEYFFVPTVRIRLKEHWVMIQVRGQVGEKVVEIARKQGKFVG